jgi:hypothetical protein
MRWVFAILVAVFAQELAQECLQGDYEVTGHKTGVAVKMNYTSSYIHRVGDKTYLTLDFLVPTMYFHSNQNVSNIIYDRSFQLSFHDRTLDPPERSACFSRRSGAGSENCPVMAGGTPGEPSPVEQWTETVSTLDPCLTVVSGMLPWDEMMRFDYHDKSRIDIQEANRTINGFDTPTWEVYMVAIIETWAGFEEVSLIVDGQTPNQLVINEERYSYYEIPFRISFPQQITLIAPEIRIAAPMVTLYAVIEQEIQDINFNPADGEHFGTVELTIKTQTQYPFGLRNHTDPVAPALIRTLDGDIKGDPQWISSDNPEVCTPVDGSADNYLCEQEWTVLITPNLCDVSGTYQMELWALCFNDVSGCALDAFAPAQSSNTWTGYLDFTVQAQNFCPQIVDEITVTGNIEKFAESTYTEEAIPGSNVFSNDYVWFEVTYRTKSAKSGLTFDEGDDSFIEFVRPYNIDMGVSMTFAPLQFSVVRDFGEVSGTELDYTVNLCTATEAVYPYDTVVDDCFDEDRKGWNAINYLDFNEALNNLGSNTIDMNEIGFSLRLDERVIPVDLPNDQAVVTISVDSEVYYHGNNNPVRRRMTYVERISRRSLQNQEGLHTQTSRVSDSFGVTRRSELSWCLLDSGSDDVFRLDVAMDALQFPKRQSVVRDVNALVLSLTQHFTVSLDKVDVLQVDTCDDDNCSPLWTKLNKFDGLRSAIKFVRYYLHIKDFNVAQQLQDQLYNGGAVYQTEWFAPHGETSKKLKDMKIEKCFGEFTDLKVTARSNGNSYVPKLDAQEASASGLAVFAAIVSLFALL